MSASSFSRIVESGVFEWPWKTPHGLLVVCGAAGGGGGGGGAFCMEGLNIFGAGGGGGGGGGEATSVDFGQTAWRAGGGNGGGGGGGGGLYEGKPAAGACGVGCSHGNGGGGGEGGMAQPADGRLVSSGGEGGKGFPGETLIVELADLSVGDRFELSIGEGGGGGGGGQGYENGAAGGEGANGFVLFVALYADEQGGG